MYRILRTIIPLMLVCLMLSSCKTQYPTAKNVAASSSAEFGFVGCLRTADADLPQITVARSGMKYFINESEYYSYDLRPHPPLVIGLSSHWRLDLSFFEPFGKTEDGILAHTIKDDASQQLVLLTETDANSKITCLVRTDSKILDIESYTFDDFEVLFDENAISSDDAHKAISFWNAFLGKTIISPTKLPSENASAKAHTMLLQSRNTSALAYLMPLLEQNGRMYLTDLAHQIQSVSYAGEK